MSIRLLSIGSAGRLLLEMAACCASPFAGQRTARLAGVLACASLLYGCAVNDIGLVRTRYYENDTAFMVDLEAWGAHLLTTRADAGLTLGHSRRKYLFRRGGPGEVSHSVWDESAAKMPAVICDPCPSLDSLGEPLFTAKEVTGLSLDANANRIGLNLGVRRSAMLMLPADGSEMVLIKYSNGDDGALRAIVSKEVDR